MVQDVLKLNRRDRAHRETFQLSDFLRTFVAQFCQIEKVPEEVIVLQPGARARPSPSTAAT